MKDSAAHPAWEEHGLSRTECAIVKAFWSLLEEKPYGSITVRDIVSRCRIHRNTFYYHFQDVPALLDTTLRIWADSLVGQARFDTAADCVLPIARCAMEQWRVLDHVYRSVRRDEFVALLERTNRYIVTRHIEAATRGLRVSPQDKALLILYYKSTFQGVVLDWLNADMAYDLVDTAARLCALMDGTGRNAVLRLLDGKTQ